MGRNQNNGEAVIPAQAGIHMLEAAMKQVSFPNPVVMVSRLRGNDGGVKGHV